MANHLPNQRVSEKTKLSPDFYKPTCDYYITLGGSLNNRTETLNNFKAANGVIDPAKFKDVISPFTADIDEVLPKLPGEIRDIDFITPIKEKNLGEYIELPYRFFVKAENIDTILKLDMDVREEIYSEMIKEFQMLVEQEQVSAEAAQQQGQAPPPPIDFTELYNTRLQELVNDKSIDATNLLHLINTESDFDILRTQLFYDWWATEEFYTYREIVNDRIVKQRISPLDAFPISNGSQFVKDYDAFVWKNYLTYEQLLEKSAINKDITGKELDALNTLSRKNGMLVYSQPEIIWSKIDQSRMGDFSKSGKDLIFSQNDTRIIEWNVIWKSQSEAKELLYLDEYGNVQRKIVVKDYVINPEIGDLELKTIWVPAVYHIKRYGEKNIGIYTKPTKLMVQMYDESTNTLELPIGGKQGLLLNININPIPKRIVPFMIVDKLLLLIIEREISKYLPYIKAIPQGMINPDSTGTTKQKFALLKADNTIIYDETKIDPMLATQGLRVIQNQGLAEYLNVLWEMRRMNKEDAWDIANMNNERFGNTSGQQTVTNASQNIYRAKLGSTLMITMFNYALEIEHKMDLEYSKYAYANGKEGLYFDKREGEFVNIKVNPFEHINNKYFPVVVNSKVDEDKLKQYKDLAFSAAQNGELDIAAEAIDADSIPHLKKIIREVLDAKKKFEESIATRKEEINLQAQQEVTARQEALIAAEKERQTSINDTDVEVKYIDADIAKYKVDNQDKGGNNENINNDNDVVQQSQIRIAERKQQLEERKFTHTKIMDNKKYELEVKKANQPKPKSR